MKIPISPRLLTCAGFVRPGDRVADIGCDHGYLSIYLLENAIAASCIAADVRPAPLASAVRNAEKFGVSQGITFCLSDGVRAIPRDFDTLVCAGMGGDTMIHILEDAPWLMDSRYRLILQCQSKRPELRRYLSDRGYAITRETLVRDGRFLYPVMEVTYRPGPALSEAETYITPALWEDGSPLLPDFLAHVLGGIRKAAQYAPSQARLLEELEKASSEYQSENPGDCHAGAPTGSQ